MPTIHRLPDARIEIRARDHAPAHCHVVFSDGRDVLVELANSRVLGRMPARRLDEALAWIAAHREELLHKWKEMNP